jgi:hypothetical protein
MSKDNKGKSKELTNAPLNIIDRLEEAKVKSQSKGKEKVDEEFVVVPDQEQMIMRDVPPREKRTKYKPAAVGSKVDFSKMKELEKSILDIEASLEAKVVEKEDEIIEELDHKLPPVITKKGLKFEKAQYKPERYGDQGSFTDFTPINLNEYPEFGEIKAENVMRPNSGANTSTVARMVNIWSMIAKHVRDEKPVFFIAPVAGMPPSFYSKSPNAVKSKVFMGSGDVKKDDLPEGQFHFGCIAHPNAVESLQNMGFLVVGLSGSAGYYKKNLKDSRDKEAKLRTAIDINERIANLVRYRTIPGCIDKPCKLLSVLVEHNSSKSNESDP